MATESVSFVNSEKFREIGLEYLPDEYMHVVQKKSDRHRTDVMHSSALLSLRRFQMSRPEPFSANGQAPEYSEKLDRVAPNFNRFSRVERTKSKVERVKPKAHLH